MGDKHMEQNNESLALKVVNESFIILRNIMI